VHAVDWNEVTAIATAALALLTFILAGAAIHAARYAKRDIDTQLETSAADLRATREATVAAQEMAQRQLEASYRPLLIDVAPDSGAEVGEEVMLSLGEPVIHLSFPGGHTGEVAPYNAYVGLSGPRVNVAVPLRNVGNGLAVISPLSIRLLGQRVLEQRRGEQVADVRRPRVPPGETTRILCAPQISHAEMAEYPWILTLRVPYFDFAGGQGSVAIVHLAQPFQDGPWSLLSVTHEALVTDAPSPWVTAPSS
jgi:hypothetical protein